MSRYLIFDKQGDFAYRAEGQISIPEGYAAVIDPGIDIDPRLIKLVDGRITYDLDNYSDYELSGGKPELTIYALKARKKAELYNAVDGEAGKITDRYPSCELQSWPLLAAEVASGAEPKSLPLFSAIAQYSGQPVDALIKDFVARLSNYQSLIGYLIAQRMVYEQMIDDARNRSELAEIKFTFQEIK